MSTFWNQRVCFGIKNRFLRFSSSIYEDSIGQKLKAGIHQASYATDLVNHPNAVVRVIDLYPPPSTLSEMQVQFGLEDEGPDADVDAADSLDAFESSHDHDEDRDTFAYLLADA